MAGAIPTADQVKVSDRVITGGGPEDAVPFAKALLRELASGAE